MGIVGRDAFEVMERERRQKVKLSAQISVHRFVSHRAEANSVKSLTHELLGMNIYDRK